MPAVSRSADELGCAVRSALGGVVPDRRMHAIRREIWRGLLRRMRQSFAALSKPSSGDSEKPEIYAEETEEDRCQL